MTKHSAKFQNDGYKMRTQGAPPAFIYVDSIQGLHRKNNINDVRIILYKTAYKS